MTSLPTAVMRKPVSGSSAGSVAFSFRSEARIFLGGIRAACSSTAVRSSTTSRKVKRYSLRGPRLGATKPEAIRPVMTPRERPSISWMARIV